MNDKTNPQLSANLNLLTVQQEKSTDYIDLLRMFPYRPTLFVGLGGTGCAAVVKVKQALKKVFAEVRGQEVMTEDVPAMFAFRAFDTNQSDQYDLAPNEMHYLCMDDVRRFQEEHGNHAFYRDWLPQHIDLTSLTQGAGGFRAYGRLALSFNIAKFADAITSAKQQILAPDNRCLRQLSPIVYVFCSLSGGTGSGMLLDACFYLRENLPRFCSVGFIALLEGAPTTSHTAQRNAKVGCHAAMKELNAFMTGHIPVEECAHGKKFRYPNRNITSRYQKPFDYCFLLGRSTKDRETLQTQDEITSFMSRSAFVMSACQFEGGTTPDFFGVAVNRVTELDQTLRGTKTSFLVPALGQIHFPLEDAVDWLCLRVSEDLLRHLSGGKKYEGDEDAAAFAASNKLDRFNLENIVRHDASGTPLAAQRYDAEMQERLKDLQVAYQQGKAILSHGEDMLTTRLSAIKDMMRPATQACVAEVRAALHERVSSMLIEPKFLYAGAQDLLADLLEIVMRERANLAKDNREQLEPRCGSIKTRWEPVCKLVEDVVTDSGVINRLQDRLNLAKCRDWYITFLNEAESALFDKATNDMAVEILSDLAREIENLQADLKVLYETHISGAISLLKAKRCDLAQKLLDQERARGEKPEDILSISVISQEVREKWIQNNAEFLPQSVLVTLSDPHEKTKQPKWTPQDWLRLKSADGVAQPKERLVAQDVVSRVNRLLGAWRARNIADVVNESKGLRGMSPADYLANTIHSLAKPQLRLNQNAVMQLEPEPIPFICGVTPELAAELRRHSAFSMLKQLGRARSFERNRITYFAAYMPVATAGIADLEATFHSAYQNWLEESAEDSTPKGQELRESEIRKFHCFPGSISDFPDPCLLAGKVEGDLVLFAKALAISGLVEATPEDVAQMKKKKGPKEKSYALFRYGRSHFWLWPFFTPHENQDMDNPLPLGSNIDVAYDTFKKDSEAEAQATKWVRWFEVARQSLFTIPELQTRMQKFIKDLPSKEPDPKRKKLWDDLKEALDEWKEELS